MLDAGKSILWSKLKWGWKQASGIQEIASDFREPDPILAAAPDQHHQTKIPSCQQLNLQPPKAFGWNFYWPMPWHVKEPCRGRSRRVNRAKNIPWTLNPQPTQPPTNSTNYPHLWSTFAAQKPNPVSAWKSQTFHSRFNNPLRIASLKGSIFLKKWECASFL